eukprot:2672644-Rhodomonas_salina.1
MYVKQKLYKNTLDMLKHWQLLQDIAQFCCKDSQEISVNKGGGDVHICARLPSPVEHAPPHLRCYNLQKTLHLHVDGAGFLNQVYLQPDPTHVSTPAKPKTL